MERQAEGTNIKARRELFSREQRRSDFKSVLNSFRKRILESETPLPAKFEQDTSDRESIMKQHLHIKIIEHVLGISSHFDANAYPTTALIGGLTKITSNLNCNDLFNESDVDLLKKFCLYVFEQHSNKHITRLGTVVLYNIVIDNNPKNNFLLNLIIGTTDIFNRVLFFLEHETSIDSLECVLKLFSAILPKEKNISKEYSIEFLKLADSLSTNDTVIIFLLLACVGYIFAKHSEKSMLFLISHLFEQALKFFNEMPDYLYNEVSTLTGILRILSTYVFISENEKNTINFMTAELNVEHFLKLLSHSNSNIVINTLWLIQNAMVDLKRINTYPNWQKILPELVSSLQSLAVYGDFNVQVEASSCLVYIFANVEPDAIERYLKTNIDQILTSCRDMLSHTQSQIVMNALTLCELFGLSSPWFVEIAKQDQRFIEVLERLIIKGERQVSNKSAEFVEKYFSSN